MIRRRVLIAVLVSAVTALAAGAPSAQAAPPTTSITATLSGTCSFLDTTTNQLVNGTLSGTLGVTQFTASGGQLFATGTIDATCTAVNGLGQTVTKTVTGTATFPVIGGQGSCEILKADLGTDPPRSARSPDRHQSDRSQHHRAVGSREPPRQPAVCRGECSQRRGNGPAPCEPVEPDPGDLGLALGPKSELRGRGRQVPPLLHLVSRGLC